VNIKNILECYTIILKNNEELLNRRLEQLKERDINLKKKEFLLSKIKLNNIKSLEQNLSQNSNHDVNINIKNNNEQKQNIENNVSKGNIPTNHIFNLNPIGLFFLYFSREHL